MASVAAPPMPPLWRQMTWWVLLFPAALALALAIQSLYLLNWVHVLSGVLWTGAISSWASSSAR